MSVPTFTRRAALVAAMALALAGCAADPDASGGGGEDAGGDIAVGALVDQTAYLKGLDNKVLDGMKAAIKEINAKGGVLDGRKLVLHVEDMGADPQREVQAFQKVSGEHQPVAFLNGFSSAGNAAAAPLAASGKRPMIVASVVPTDDPEWVYSTIVPVDYETGIRADYLAEEGLKRVAVLSDPTPYSKASAAKLKAQLKKLGLRQVAFEEHQTDAVDLRPQVARLLRAKPDAVVKLGTGPSQIVAARALANADSKVPLLIGVETDANIKQSAAAYPHLGFVVSRPTVYDDLEKSARSEKLDLLHEKFADEADLTYIARGFDAAYMLADALEKAGTTSGVELQKALNGMEPYDGGTTEYKYTADDHYGMKSNPTYLAELKGDKPTIVFPKRDG